MFIIKSKYNFTGDKLRLEFMINAAMTLPIYRKMVRR